MVKILKAPEHKKEQKNFRSSSCLDTSIAILKYSGIWMPEVNRGWNILGFIIYGCLHQFLVFICIVLAELSYILMVLDDKERTLDAAVLFLSHLVQGVKMLTIVMRQGRIKRLIKFMDGPDFTPLDSEKRAILEKSINLATIAGKVVIGAAYMTTIFWSVVPMLKSNRSLPLKTAFPFDWTKQPMFAIMYGYTSISVTVVGVCDAALNYLVSGLMIMGAVQLNVLSLALQEVSQNGKRGMGKNGISSDYVDAVICIKHHQNIIKYVDELGAIFGRTLLCQFITTSVVVCMTLYKITMTSEPVELVTIIFYLSCVFIELLMYCFPGDLLINKSLLVSEAAFPNNWSGDIRTQKALMLTALRAQKALVLNAGGMFKASLPTAAAVVRSAYSYYAVLRQKMNEEDN